MEKLKIEWVDINRVFENTGQIDGVPENPRNIDETNEKRLAKSVEELPEMSEARPPLVVEKNGVYVVIDGNQRLKAHRNLNHKTLPVIILPKDLPAEKLRRMVLIGNEQYGETDWKKLKTWEKTDLKDWEIKVPKGWFNEFAADNVVEDNFSMNIDEANEKCFVKKGDLYRLGSHLLYCGSATEKESFEILLNNEKAALVLTDPPYGCNAVKHKQKGSTCGKVGGGGQMRFKGKVGGGGMRKSKVYFNIKGDDSTETAKEFYEIAKDFSENQIIFGGNFFTNFLQPSKCWLVWDKMTTGDFGDCELAWTSFFDNHNRVYKWLWNGLCRQGDRASELLTRIHPTQKPVGMLANILKDFSRDGDVIIDAFGGSGSTLIACEQMNRQCRMIEIEPFYCDKIIERWETFTNQKAERVDLNLTAKEAISDLQQTNQ